MDDPDRLWLPAGELVKLLDIHRRTFYRYVKKLGITSEPHEFRETLIPCYPPGTYSQVRFLCLPKYLKLKEIADFLGRSQGWTRKELGKLGWNAITKKGSSKRTLRFHKDALSDLQRRQLPIAEHELNLSQLVEITGCDREWIERRLRRQSIRPRQMLSPLTGKALWFYPVKAELIVRRESHKPPAKGWLTADAIQRSVSKSSNWVRRRLTLPENANLAEVRLDSRRVPRLHYPPSVLKRLNSEITSAKRYPPAQGWYTISDLAKLTSRSRPWVKNRIRGSEGQIRLDRKGRPRPHYPPRTSLILKLASELEP